MLLLNSVTSKRVATSKLPKEESLSKVFERIDTQKGCWKLSDTELRKILTDSNILQNSEYNSVKADYTFTILLL